MLALTGGDQLPEISNQRSSMLGREYKNFATSKERVQRAVWVFERDVLNPYDADPEPDKLKVSKASRGTARACNAINKKARLP